MKFCLLIAIFVLALSGIYSYKKLDELAIRGYNPELIIDVGANAGKW